LPTPVTEVVAALIWQQGTFMICQRPAHKKRGLLWEFVGGKVEPGETGEEALIRECREELGVTIAVGSEFMQVLHSYPDMTVRLTLYNAVIREGTLQMLEHNDIRWITPQEIPGYDFCPADVDILQKITEVSAYYPMYMELEWYARSHNLSQTLRALPFAERLHTGQFRSSHSDTKRPYFCHPLQVAAHAVALGLCEDGLLAAALLHDVCEDCGVAPEELPVEEQVQHTVRLLTKTYPRRLSAEEKEKALISYFAELSGERHALLIKLLDPAISMRAKILVNQSSYEYLDSLTDEMGRPLINIDPMTGESMIFKNRQIVLMSDAQLPNNAGKYPLYVGDFTQYATLFERGGMEMTATDIGGGAFESNGISVRGIKRMGTSVFDKAAAVRREIQPAT